MGWRDESLQSSVTCLLEEEMELRVGVGVQSDFKQRHEDVVQQLLKVVNDPRGLVDIIQPRQLQHTTKVRHIAKHQRDNMSVMVHLHYLLII